MEIAIITLGIIVLAQVVERHLYAKEMNRQLDNATKKVMSRNMNEYLAAQAIDKATENIEIKEPDEVDTTQMSDEQFDSFIKEQNK